MATEKQLNANRENAKRSTGPKSAAGRTKSSRNAVTHDLSSRAPIIHHEDAERFDALRQGLFRDLQPSKTLEIEYFERIVQLVWRLRRISSFEAAFLTWVRSIQADQPDARALIGSRDTALSREIRAIADADEKPALFLSFGKMVKMAFGDSDALAKLSRHETHLSNQLQRTLADFETRKSARLQAAVRSRQTAGAEPISIDEGRPATSTPSNVTVQFKPSPTDRTEH